MDWSTSRKRTWYGPAVAVEDGHRREPEFREGFVFRLAHVLSHAAAAQGRPRRRRAGWLPERIITPMPTVRFLTV